MGDRSGLEGFLKARIEAGDFPGASYLVAEGDRIVAEGALGHAVMVPERIHAATTTLYDLASLTKPLATALLAVQLQAEKRLTLDAPLSLALPAWRDAQGGRAITLLDLLTHRSGLPAWAPLYIHARDKAERIAWIAEIPSSSRPGAEVVYSDLGYILAGFALEAVTGRPLDRLFLERVAQPIGREDLLYRPGPALKQAVAATEAGNERERALAGPEGARYNGWRSEVIWGEVHDFNAFTMGGVGGHAGLFGTARSVWLAAKEFLGSYHGIVPDDAGRLFQTNHTSGLSEDRSVGFQLASTSGSSAGEALSGRSFGHSGFTGTSLWIDPERGRIYVLLTNRVHPRYRELAMNAIRREFHALAAAL